MAITSEHREQVAPQVQTPTTSGESSSDDRIEFLFAQFVDMHGKPSAKLVPAHHLDDLLDRRRRLRRVRRRRHRPGPARSGHDRDARPDDADDPALAPERRAVRVRRDRRGRAVAVLPAHDPAPRARPRRRSSGYELKIGAELEYFLRAPARRRHDRGRRPARHARPALLRHARADPQPRLRLRGLEGGDRARLGQLRDRSRGRQRPVRAELPVRRRADHVRPGGVLPLHGRVAGAAARADRDVHAQAVRAPDRQRLPLPRQPVDGRRERVRARSRRGSRAVSACPSSPTASSAA